MGADGGGAEGLRALLFRPALVGAALDAGNKVRDVVGFDDRLRKEKRRPPCWPW